MTSRLLTPAEFRELPFFGVGLTDIVKSQAGNDLAIDFGDASPEALRKKVLHFAPKLLCFNGKHAAKVYFRSSSVAYGLQSETIASTKLFVAPSTSAAANRWWDIAIWRAMAEFVA